MNTKIIKVPPLKVRKNTPVPDGYIETKHTKSGVEIKLTGKARKEIAKRLEKDKPEQ